MEDFYFIENTIWLCDRVIGDKRWPFNLLVFINIWDFVCNSEIVSKLSKRWQYGTKINVFSFPTWTQKLKKSLYMRNNEKERGFTWTLVTQLTWRLSWGFVLRKRRTSMTRSDERVLGRPVRLPGLRQTQTDGCEGIVTGVCLTQREALWLETQWSYLGTREIN